MAIKTNRSWTELYYRTVEHYFWRPGDIGRKATGSGEGWAHWRERLDKQEAPLQHILDLFFYIAPDHLLVDTLSSFLGRDIDHVELVTTDQKTLDPRIVQPDLVAIGRAQLIFLEMKVNAKSSVDQFVKYAIAAHRIAAERPELESTDLLILSRTTEHHRIWHWCTKLALTSAEAVRGCALRGLRGDDGVWKEKGVKRYLAENPEDLEPIVRRVQTMGLHLVDYHALAGVLERYRGDRTVERLVSGVLTELDRRGLA